MDLKATWRKHLSLQAMRDVLTSTARRFPLPLLITLSGSVIWTVVLEQETNEDILVRVLWTLAVALPLFIGLAVIAESGRWSRLRMLAMHGLAIIGCVGFYWALPADMDFVPFADIFRSLLLGGSAILLMLIAGVVAHKQVEMNFWQYAVRIFSDVLLAVALGMALFAGLSAAFSTVDFLFDVSIPSERYPESAVFALGIFAMTFFLARFPQATVKDALDDKSSLMYRKEFTLLAQYVLLPLVTIYFVIMYVYGFKIVLTNKWPDGSVSNFIIAFAIVGIFAYMLLYPRLAQTRWLRVSGTIFYAAVLPLTGLLFWAIILRIQQYAWTERRYLTVVFGVWLVAASVYFLASKRKDIRLVPVTLTVILVLSSFGPWGALSVSRWSQTNRLLDIAERYQLVENGYFKPAADDQVIADEDRKEISAIIDYLYQRHGIDAVEKVLNQDLSQLVEKNKHDSYRLPKIIMQKKLNISYVPEYERIAPVPVDTKNGFRFFSTRDFVDQFQPEPILITSYDYMVTVASYDPNTVYNFSIEKRKYTLEIDMPTNRVTLTDSTSGETIIFDLTEQMRTLFTTYPENLPNIPREALHFTPQSANENIPLQVEIYGDEIGFEMLDGDVEMNTLFGQLFITLPH